MSHAGAPRRERPCSARSATGCIPCGSPRSVPVPARREALGDTEKDGSHSLAWRTLAEASRLAAKSDEALLEYLVGVRARGVGMDIEVHPLGLAAGLVDAAEQEGHRRRQLVALR